MSIIPWYTILRKIFDHDAIIVIIKGYWKTGKTNVALTIIEDLLDLGIIKIAGTNIKIKESDEVRYIEDMPSLKEFHYDDPINPMPKCFVFDEAGKLATKRRAMGRANIGWMQFIPELSKGRMKLIVITQSEFLTDSIFTQTEFTRAFITTYKHEKYGYSIGVESELLDVPLLYINKFRKTNIQYSPYQSAEFFLERRKKDTDTRQLLCCDISYQYAVENKSTTTIANELGFKSRTQITRLLKRHIRHTFNKLTPEDLEKIVNEAKQKEPPETDKEKPLSTPPL